MCRTARNEGTVRPMTKAAERTWLVSSGVYSDYTILAVVLGTKAHAERVAARFRDETTWRREIGVSPVDLYREDELPEPVTFHYFSWLHVKDRPVETEIRSVTAMPCDTHVGGNAGIPTERRPLCVVRKGRMRVDVTAFDFHAGKAAFDAEVEKIAGRTAAAS